MTDSFRLDGRKALVTGAARGLGAGIARALVAAGADVALGDISIEEGRATAAALERLGHGRVIFVEHDVASADGWQLAVAHTVRKLGGFDLLVNNAGALATSRIADLDAVALRGMLDVNVIGTALGMKHAFRAMRPGGIAGKGGAVVNVASAAAALAVPGLAGYSAASAAIDRLTRVGAAESGALGYGVRVNCVYPGLVATEMGLQLAGDLVALGLADDVSGAVGGAVAATPLGRLGEVIDVAAAIVFLASDASRFVTGAGLAVDGGMSG